MTPVKKLVLIILLTLAATFISLPQKMNLFGKEITRPSINLKIGNFSLPNNFPMHLGLDLAGGSQLTFEADMSKISVDKQADALTGVRNIIENRVNMFGLSESGVRTSKFEGKDRIIVELPGISDTQSAIDLIGKTAQLSFAEVKEIPSESGATPSATLIPTDLTGADLKTAQVTFDSNNGKPSISLQFTEEGGKKFAEITKRNVGKQLPIILDNQIISAPIVNEEIIGGNAQITGNFTVDEAKKLAVQLNAGALPVPINLIEQKTVEATLGAESVQKSAEQTKARRPGRAGPAPPTAGRGRQYAPHSWPRRRSWEHRRANGWGRLGRWNVDPRRPT